MHPIDDLLAVFFIDAQLRQGHFKKLERMMRAGVKFLDAVAKRKHKAATFAQLSPELQDDVLNDFRDAKVPKLKFPQRRFFLTLHTLGLEGYWGDPKYGGNREEQAWSWVSIDPHCPHMHGATSSCE